jgi:hypothetical protein
VTVPLRVLAPVQREVRPDEQFLDALAGFRHGDPDARVHPHRGTAGRHRLRERRLQRAGALGRRVGPGQARDQGDELVGADPGQQFAGPQRAGEAGGRRDEHVVAGRPAEGPVDGV